MIHEDFWEKRGIFAQKKGASTIMALTQNMG
ncbi:hypothetical protein N007_13220 [Alicyclobacillus acidoterrestris ATCC 49025]|nr:hypothetical protein N007_13220 [Alicyclobacillus acidoterrestris ATCC 49025]